MSFMALEISVNGERLYTVGAEDWHTLWVHILGHRMTPDRLTPEMMPPGVEVPDKDVQGIDLHALVSVPGGGDNAPSILPPQKDSEFNTGNYKSRQLKVGDVVTVKVIETGAADKPNAPQPDLKLFGRTVFPADPDSE